MSRKHPGYQRSKWRSLYVWHRYLGLTAAIVMLLIASSGLLLNHTEELRLDERFTRNPALLDHYGISASDPVSFAAEKHWVSLVEENLYFNTQQIPIHPMTLIGAVQLQNIIAIASDTSVHLLTVEGEIIESLGAASDIKTPILAIGQTDTGKIILRSESSLSELNPELTRATLISSRPQVKWSNSTGLPIDIKQRILEKAFTSALPVERIILDLHSGRFFGDFGFYVFDLFAVIFIFLSVSGCTIWLKQHLKHRQHMKKYRLRIK